jgi:hypothetical protein
MTVTVSGPSAPTSFGLTASGSVAGAGHLLTATIDSRPKGTTDFDWKPVANMSATLSASNLLGPTGTTTWTGTFLTTPSSNASTDYRLRIEEVEQFAAADPGTSGNRPVYVDTFPL